jgi:methanogenic corrinoid protein MtbC1
VPEHSAAADNSVGREAERRAATVARSYLEALRAADAGGAYRLASGILGEGLSLAALYQDVITPAMYELGRLWERGAITIADEHLATALTHRVLGALTPLAFADQTLEKDSPKPRAMLAAVQGEQHALGLRMAADLLEDAGCEAIYLGADVPVEALMQAIASFSPDLLGLSATMPELGDVLEGTVAGVRSEYPELGVLVGGQASASPRIEEATPVENLRLLEGRAKRLLASRRA